MTRAASQGARPLRRCLVGGDIDLLLTTSFSLAPSSKKLFVDVSFTSLRGPTTAPRTQSSRPATSKTDTTPYWSLARRSRERTATFASKDVGGWHQRICRCRPITTPLTTRLAPSSTAAAYITKADVDMNDFVRPPFANTTARTLWRSRTARSITSSTARTSPATCPVHRRRSRGRTSVPMVSMASALSSDRCRYRKLQPVEHHPS